MYIYKHTKHTDAHRDIVKGRGSATLGLLFYYIYIYTCTHSYVCVRAYAVYSTEAIEVLRRKYPAEGDSIVPRSCRALHHWAQLDSFHLASGRLLTVQYSDFFSCFAASYVTKRAFD